LAHPLCLLQRLKPHDKFAEIKMLDLQYIAAIAGTLGGALSIGAFVPQVIRIVRRRSAADVSLTMYLVIMAASVLWMFYAQVHRSMELFVTNLVIGAIASLIAVLKIRYSEK
jgi:MtN3 and saliva related transmembrane protein